MVILLSQVTTTFLLGLLVGNVKGDLFTAMSELETLAKAEEEAVNILEMYLEEEYKKLKILRKYSQQLAQCWNSTGQIMDPLNIFLLTKHLHSAHILIQENISINSWNRISTIFPNFPTRTDLTGAALAIFRLQDTFELTTENLSNGFISSDISSPTLSSSELYELGRIAHDMDDSYHAVLWLQQTQQKLKMEDTPSVNHENILDYLSSALFQQGNVERALDLCFKWKETTTTRLHCVTKRIEYYKTFLKEQYEGEQLELPPLRLTRIVRLKRPEFKQYEKMCRGEMPVKSSSAFICYYKKNIPFLRLARMKVEIMHIKPTVLLFRNVVSDEESEGVKMVASPKFTRGEVFMNSEDDQAMFAASQTRTSKIAWLEDEEHEVARILSKRVEHMTDLSCQTAEYLQVANYGIGGQYEPHIDHAPDPGYPGADMFDYWGAGNRIATVLFYLSQPTFGGSTVFPDLGVVVQASKNDALFWYNVLRSGKGDDNVVHASCPVLSGTKWVANKWIHEYGQEYRRPCALDKDNYE